MTNSYGKGIRLAALGLAGAAALCLAAPAHAGEERATARGQKEPGAGLLAAIDGAGRLRQPTPAESRALVAGIKSMSMTEASEPQVMTWPDGTQSIDLTGTFMNVWVAQAGANGTLQSICINTAEDADALLNSAPALEEK
jgi:hypothetical protein